MTWKIFLILGFSVFLRAETASTGKEISGVVRIIRGQPQTEVFFKDLKDSVIIPRNSKHNQIYEACDISWKKGTPVKLVIDPISRQVLSLPAPASTVVPTSTSDSTTGESVPASTPSSSPGESSK